MNVRHPLLLLLLSIAFFLLCDNLIFRSGLYATLYSPLSTPGTLYHVVHYLNARPPSGKKDVLLIGNSQLEWDFSMKQFDDENPDAPIKFDDGYVSGTLYEVWYYMLKSLDPTQNRYAAIAIQNEAYQALPLHYDPGNSYVTVETLTSILTLRQWPEFIESFTDPDVRRRAALAGAFSSHAYALDLQDFLCHPTYRFKILPTLEHDLETGRYNAVGVPASMEGLKVDPVTWKPIVYPSNMDYFERWHVDDYFHSLPPEDAKRFTARNAAYEAYWIGKIAELYENSSTKLIFFQVPRWPVKMPTRAPIDGAPDIRNMIPHRPNIVFLDEVEPEALEKPKYFHDVMHLDAEGRQLFTRQLGAAVKRVMAGE